MTLIPSICGRWMSRNNIAGGILAERSASRRRNSISSAPLVEYGDGIPDA